MQRNDRNDRRVLGFLFLVKATGGNAGVISYTEGE